jgi:hypothetical protein
MNEFDPEQFEAELKTLHPAKPPEQAFDKILTRLTRRTDLFAEGPFTRRTAHRSWNFLRWLAPATAAATITLLLLHNHLAAKRNQIRSVATSSAAKLKADKIEIDRQLIANFDAIARLPSGEPVRFRCEQWTDKVRVRDSAAGLVLERTTPRLEIVPVSFDTY